MEMQSDSVSDSAIQSKFKKKTLNVSMIEWKCFSQKGLGEVRHLQSDFSLVALVRKNADL